MKSASASQTRKPHPCESFVAGAGMAHKFVDARRLFVAAFFFGQLFPAVEATVAALDFFWDRLRRRAIHAEELQHTRCSSVQTGVWMPMLAAFEATVGFVFIRFSDDLMSSMHVKNPIF
jgi:hypothetical protein